MPFVAAPVTVKFGALTPSASVTVSVPLIAVSSTPLPPVSPPKLGASSTSPTTTVTVLVSVTPPLVTV